MQVQHVSSFVQAAFGEVILGIREVGGAPQGVSS